VKKLNISNKLFLDLASLSKNMQALLSNYEMFVIAQVSEISAHLAQPGNSGCEKYGLVEGEVYHKCTVEKVEHIVNFTSHVLNKPKKDGESVDYSFTDYVCK
jgi:hypothetical protein